MAEPSFPSSPPPNIDVLLTEGTNLGSDKPVPTETELEREFVELFKRTRGLRGYYQKIGREDFATRMVLHETAARRLAAGGLVVMVRRGLLPDY